GTRSSGPGPARAAQPGSAAISTRSWPPPYWRNRSFFPTRARGTRVSERLSAKSVAQPGSSPARSPVLARYSCLAAQILIMRDILHWTVFGVAGGSAEISVPVPRGDTAPDGLAFMRELLTSLPAAVAHLSGPDLIIDFANEACLQLISGRDL